jgi:hypothetical protein
MKLTQVIITMIQRGHFFTEMYVFAIRWKRSLLFTISKSKNTEGGAQNLMQNNSQINFNYFY